MEIKHEHEWESMGGVAKELYTDYGRGFGKKDKYGEVVIFAFFCKKCGEIREKEV